MPDAKQSLPSLMRAALLLADGTVFEGYSIGSPDTAMGEICFNTAMTGYQEVLTDPSYAGQIIAFTFPHIGNVGCNGQDVESYDMPVKGASGLVLREAITAPSNFRADMHLNDWLRARSVSGICGVDTRALTLHIRKGGAQNAIIASFEPGSAKSALQKAAAQLALYPSLEGRELCVGVSTPVSYEWSEPRWSLNGEDAAPASGLHVVAVDYGEKLNILRCLASLGCKVTVVPAQTSAEAILALKPDGVFLSNGPGDPAATGKYALAVIRTLVESGLPVFGICLGHQLLALAMGGTTQKMRQGHRGVNHPIKNHATGKVEITSQNHGFTVDAASLPAQVEVTHTSLFDGTVAGLKIKGKPVFSVQYHPESSPGPHDSLYLFEEFVKGMQSHASV